MVNKAVNNVIFVCKRRKESFHLQNAYVKYILDGICIDKEYLNL